VWGFVGLIALQLWLGTLGPVARVLSIFVTGVLGWACLSTIRGFRYFVWQNGLEVRGLLRQIEAVPASDVLHWEIVTCRPLADFGGWGIRKGRDGSRAFILNRGRCVRIQTPARTLFLGLDRADELASALERMKR
jgi:hypothetical protein